jgi:hypothetical protein
MNSPGYKSLGSFTIGAAGTQLGEWTTADFDGMLALLVQMRLAYGSGGTSIKVYLQTTFDSSNTPIDIACFTFLLASAVKLRNFSALTPKATDVTPSDGALADDTSVDGVLGTKFRLKVVSLGTYGTSTQLVADMVAR